MGLTADHIPISRLYSVSTVNNEGQMSEPRTNAITQTSREVERNPEVEYGEEETFTAGGDYYHCVTNQMEVQHIRRFPAKQPVLHAIKRRAIAGHLEFVTQSYYKSRRD